MSAWVIRKYDSNIPSALKVLVRGAKMRCPRCSQDSLYQRCNVFKSHYKACGYGFEEREGNCWFFLYSTTAALTGLFIILILLWRPDDVLFGRIVLGVSSVGLIALSLPPRKGIALALEYLSEIKGSNLLLYEDTNQKDNPQ